MEEMWVLVGDELRMDKVNSYDDLIKENGDLVKGYGTFKINVKAKIIEFFLDPKLTDKSWYVNLTNVKAQGFYSPMISNYQWIFSIDTNYPRRSAMIS